MNQELEHDEPDYAALCRDCKNLESECRCPLVRPLTPEKRKFAMDRAVAALNEKFNGTRAR